jgi:hypothetical protein
MAPRVSVETVYALLLEYKSQMGEFHGQNQKSLERLDRTTERIETGVDKTNGTIIDHDRRIENLERASRSHVPLPPESRDWKVIGSGIGAVVFAIWGAVEALRLLFDFVGKIGGAVVGKGG